MADGKDETASLRESDVVSGLGERFDSPLDRIDARIRSDRIEAGIAQWEAAGARLERWLDRAAETESVGRWLRYLFSSVAVSVLVVAGLRVLLVLLGNRGVTGWLGVIVVGTAAIVLQVVVFHELITTVAAPENRRSLFTGLLLSFGAALLTVEAFAALVVQLGWLELWPAEHALLWNLADSVPILDITHRLGWVAPALPDNVVGRVLLLAFKIVAIVPVARLAIAAFLGVTVRVGGRRVSGLYGLFVVLPFVGVGGLAWAALGPNTPAWHIIGAHSGFAFIGLIAVILVGFLLVVAALLWVGTLIGGGWLLVINEGGPAGAFIAGAVLGSALLWIAPVRHAMLPVADSLSTGSRVVLTIGVAVASAVLLGIDGFNDYLPAGTTLLCCGIVIGLLRPAPASTWLSNRVRWTPWGIELGQGLATAFLWAGVGFLLVVAINLPTSMRGSALFGWKARPGRIMLDGLYAATRLVICAAALLVALQSQGWMPLAYGETRPSAVTDLVDLSWHVVDSIPGPHIPAILDWRLSHDLTGRGVGPFILCLLLLVMVIVGFPTIRDLLAWGARRSNTPTVPIEQTTQNFLTGLRAILEAVARAANSDARRRPWLRRRRSTDAAPRIDAMIDDMAFEQRRISQLLGSTSPTTRASMVALTRTTAAHFDIARRRARGDAAASLLADAAEAVDFYAEHVRRWSEHLAAIAELPKLDDIDEDDDAEPQASAFADDVVTDD